MKIEYEIKDVKVVRHSTIAAALATVYGPAVHAKERVDLVGGLMGRNFHVADPHYYLLHQPLAREYEGESVYRRTCALVTLDRDWQPSEFSQELDKKGYYRASTSETVAYLGRFKEQRVDLGTVVHLGTFILDDVYQQRRLVTRDGKVDLPVVLPTTRLKHYHMIVVIEKEVPFVPKRAFFGRKK